MPRQIDTWLNPITAQVERHYEMGGVIIPSATPPAFMTAERFAAERATLQRVSPLSGF